MQQFNNDMFFDNLIGNFVKHNNYTNGGVSMQFTKYVSTKVDEEGAAVKTNLTIDISDLSDADKNEIIVSAAVIKWQGRVRRTGNIPTEATYKVPRPGTKVGMSLDEQISNLSPEERNALIERLMNK